MKRITSIKEFQEELVRLGVADYKDFVGCTQEEVELLTRSQKVSRLPALYVELLLKMGKGAGRFKVGSGWFYKSLVGLKDDLMEDAEEYGWSLPSDAFVFSEHQGYQFMYFNTESGDDPPVYMIDNFEKPRIGWDHFSELLGALIEMRQHLADRGVYDSEP